jgi:hypothetical protein
MPALYYIRFRACRYFVCHSGLDPESSLFNWILAGVYPALDMGGMTAWEIM